MPDSTCLTFIFAGIVFDYDDTILASSWLAQNNLRLDGNEPVPLEAQKQLAQLATSAAKLLQHAQAYGEVVIITNAETGWVELSAKKFMPSLLPILAKTRVISARSTYECQYSSPLEWKVRNKASLLNTICIFVLSDHPPPGLSET